MDRHTGVLREGSALAVVQITFLGHFFWVSFGQSFGFADLEPLFDIFQDPPMCVHAAPSQDGF